MKKSIKGQGRLWRTSNVPTMDGVLMYRKNVMRLRKQKKFLKTENETMIPTLLLFK